MDQFNDVEVREMVESHQLPQLVELFANEWWSKFRSLEDVSQMVTDSDLVIILIHKESGNLVGFTRVLTDGIYFAVILDVIVKPEMRGLGLGNLLMETVVAHPKVSQIRSVELVCQPEIVAFYQQFGFSDRVGRSRLMRRTSDPVLTGSSRANS